MERIISILQGRFPDISFVTGETFCWSPETKEVYFVAKPSGQSAIWSLLHETGHALLSHQTYSADFELIRLEIAAWEKAKELSNELKLEPIDEDHIQDCLDTYRDWLYARSVCPNCNNKSLQQADLRHYQCFNCHSTWQVTPSRFCRAYRSTKRAKAMTPVFNATTDL